MFIIFERNYLLDGVACILCFAGILVEWIHIWFIILLKYSYTIRSDKTKILDSYKTIGMELCY